jgi:hypothetical protein
MDFLLLLPLFVLIVLLNVAFIVLRWTRPPVILERWAERNGYYIVSKSYCWFWTGPFFWNRTNAQMVYRITVEDEDGEHWSGYVRLGNWLIGLLSDEVAEAWDRGEEPSRRYRRRPLPRDAEMDRWDDRPRRGDRDRDRDRYREEDR